MNTTQRLLLIDDESLLKVTAHQLEQFGCKVTAKASGEEGLAAFKESSFAVVVTDLQLPGVSALEVLQDIRRHDRDCVVIIITAYGSIENAVKACELGADDYLAKPFSRDEPLITVNCPSIPENLMESELFGHVEGAFTGAMKDQQGNFGQAEGGTYLSR